MFPVGVWNRLANTMWNNYVNLIKLKHTALCALLKVKRGMEGVLISLHNDMSYFVCYFRL